MSDEHDNKSEFQSFRVLREGASVLECNQLFGHMAQLFAIVSEKCDDNQVSQYDEVLCQLADMVEIEARANVALILSGLDRAPGGVVARLAHDEIDVARPLLEFSKILTDDDLIEIVAGESEEHRLIIAGRDGIGERVGDSIIQYGAQVSLARLVGNETATLSVFALEKVAARAANDVALAQVLRQRKDVDWRAVADQIGDAGARVLENLALTATPVSAQEIDHASALVYARMKSRAGFGAKEWKLAWNQVKAINDRKQLDMSAVARFTRFGYGHHVACSLTVMMNIPSEVVLKWLSTQDYVAISVALRALGVDPEIFRAIVSALPWAEVPSNADLEKISNRFDSLSLDDARGIFRLWRSHAFRRKASHSEQVSAVA